MAIKLNEKGKLKVAIADVRVVMLPTDPPKYRAQKEADALEFDTDDFKDVVVLSIEEAKVINKLVYMASCAFILTNEQLDAEEMLEKRIKQAEMKDGETL